MKKYVNMMENIVEEEIDIMAPGLGCCLCDQCRSDIAALALNHLPPQYVVTQVGSAIRKVDAMRIQHLTDIRTAIIQAAEIVRKDPRHQ